MSTAPQRQVSTASHPARYREIAVHTLRLDSVLPFTLHTQIEGEYLIYRREGLPFTATQREALLDNGLETLFIAPDQVTLYWDYLNENIRKILGDESVPILERSAALYRSTEEICRRIVSLPIDRENVQLAQNVVVESIRFQSAGKDALHSLMAQMTAEPNLHTHALNVCQYGLALARELGALSAEALEGFGTGILLMDVGMLEIPAALAFKDGPLSFDEWSLIKRHPALGLEAIDALEGVTDIVREVTFGHHERLDGSGYPQGLKGREVTAPMRIVGVAETFTALTTGRAYRPAMTTFEAIRQMRTELREGFDPRVVEALIRLVAK